MRFRLQSAAASVYFTVALVVAVPLFGCPRTESKAASASGTPPSTETGGQVGMASWYGPGFAGRPTANGERFDPKELTAAHRTHPFGTRLRVTNLANGRSVVVRVNDRGPYAKRRVIDLSEEAARRIGMIDSGVARVRIEIVD